MLAWGQIKIRACFIYNAALFLAWCAGHGETRLVAPLASSSSQSGLNSSNQQLSQAQGGYYRGMGAILQLDEVPRAVLQPEVPGVPRESHTDRVALKYLLCMGRWNQLLVPLHSCKLMEGKKIPAHPPNC